MTSSLALSQSVNLALDLYWAVTSASVLSWAATNLQPKFSSGPCLGSSGHYLGCDFTSGPRSGYYFDSALSQAATWAPDNF